MQHFLSSKAVLAAVATVLLAGLSMWLVWPPKGEEVLEEGTSRPASATPTSDAPAPGRPVATPTPAGPSKEVSREVDRWATELLASTLGLEGELLALDENESVVKADYRVAAPFPDEAAVIAAFTRVMAALTAGGVSPDTVLPEATPGGLWTHAPATLAGQSGIVSVFLPLEEPVISVVFVRPGASTGTSSLTAVSPNAAAERAVARWVTPVLTAAFGKVELTGVGHSVPGDTPPHPQFVLTYDVPGLSAAYEDLEALPDLLRQGLAGQGVAPEEVHVEPTLTGFTIRAPVTASGVEGLATIEVNGGTSTVTVAYWVPGSLPP